MLGVACALQGLDSDLASCQFGNGGIHLIGNGFVLLLLLVQYVCKTMLRQPQYSARNVKGLKCEYLLTSIKDGEMKEFQYFIDVSRVKSHIV